MQYQVPQFIEIEDKIIGPLTLKQFFYLAGPAAVSFILSFTVQWYLALLVTIILGSLGILFAFITPNGRPFANYLMSIFWYYFNPKTYIWKQTEPTKKDMPSSMIEKAPRS